MIEYECDCCGQVQSARYNINDDPIVPSGWTTLPDKRDNEDPKHVCSTGCEVVIVNEITRGV